MNSIAINFVDCAIIVLYLIFIIWWGLRNGKSSDAGSYFLAGRTMPWWIVGLSLFAASISSTTLIGQSGDAYHTGVAVFNYNLTGVVVMVFFATFLLPLYIRSGIFTIPEFLERRFDKRSRYYFSGICIVGNIFLDAAGALYAAALIIKLLFPEADLQLIIIIFAVLAASYTIPGGLSSAINAELIQAVILIVGSVILTGACFANGGFDYLASLFESGDMSVRLIRPLTDTATPWLGLIVGMPVLGIYFWANNQTLVQRVLSARSVDEGRKGVMFAGALTLATLFIIVFPGVIARHLFPGIEKPDMIYPTMVLRLLPRTRDRLSQISLAQRQVGRAGRGLPGRARTGVRLLSVLLLWSLEDGAATADSMSARGYGLPGRTSYHNYRLDGRDRAILVFLACAGAYLLLMALHGALRWRYYPSPGWAGLNAWSLSAFLVWGAVCALPLYLNWKEAREWRSISSRS